MHQVFSHPLGPFPWSLVNVDGTMKKTNKAILAKQLESYVSPAEEVCQPTAMLVDALSVIQKLNGENHTFEELSHYIFSEMLHAGRGNKRTDVIRNII